MPDLSLLQLFLSGVSGSLVGFTLGLVGGGGSILAVPLLVYLVGVPSAHVAIGTSAVAVAVNAAASVIGHARAGNVRWPCASVFASAGVAGAFAVLMIVVAVLMLLRRDDGADRVVRLNRENAPTLIGAGLGVGARSGFFGIGGGFLIVPGAGLCHGHADAPAIGTSLVTVTAFGVTTAGTYALTGLVDWPIQRIP